MYRNSQVKGFKSLIKCQQQSISSGAKESSENDNKTFETSNQSSPRSTTSILNLFKKPIEKYDKKICKESTPIKSNEEPAIVTQENISSVTNNNKTYE